jgi:cardiolipin synthase
MTAVVFHSLWETVAPWLYFAGMLFGLAVVPVVALSRKVPQAKTAWILVILGFPWVGAFLYFTLGRQTLLRKVEHLRSRRGAVLSATDEARAARGLIPPRRPRGSAAEMVLGSEAAGVRTPVPGNEFTPLTEGPDAFRAAREAIEAARHHVHMVVYIFKDDRTGRDTLALLAQAARRGVEVRVLYDGLGSFGRSGAFFRPILDAGGRVAASLPVGRLYRLLHMNLRNHRKLVVVDGRVALTGGMNVGDEYATGRNWRDLHCRIRGPVVPSLQRVFVEDWNFATEELLDRDEYFPAVERAGDVPIQVVDSGPDQADPHAEELMFSAIAAARRSIDILTPYFVPTPGIEQALGSASRRGRRVRMLLPDYVDHRIVRWATDAYLPRLLQTGVEVWRHPQMSHGKMVIVDESWVTLGSVNLDMRSLRLNFELNVAIPHTPTAALLTRHFEGELSVARRLTEEELRVPPPRRLLRATAQLLSPIL